MRRRSGAFAAAVLVGLVGLAGSARGDLDVSTPPGTPDEWTLGLPSPVTTDRGRAPDITRRAETTGDGTPVDVRETPVPYPKPTELDIPRLNSFGSFRVITPDMPGHVVVTYPAHTRNPDGTGRVATGPTSRIEGAYPPLFPPELVWDAMCTCLRINLHPEVCSRTAAITHLLAIGEPSYAGAQLVGTADVTSVINNACNVVPAVRPTLPAIRGQSPYERMLLWLAATELCNDYPGVMYPQYCRRILSVGKDAVQPLIICSELPHTHAARAATWTLQAFNTPDALAQLRKLALSNDLVIRVRALRALIRACDTGAGKIFARCVDSNDPIIRQLGWQGAMAIRDVSMMSRLRKALSDAIDMTDRDLLTVLLPGIVRMRPDKSDRVMNQILHTGLHRFWIAFDQIDPTGQQPAFGKVSLEPPGFHNQIFHEMTLMALAASGDAAAVKQFLRRGLSSFHRINWFLWCDTCHALLPDPTALQLLKDVVNGPPDPAVAAHAMQVCARGGAPPDFLADVARNSSEYVARGQALLALAHVDAKIARATCKEVLRSIDIDRPRDKDPDGDVGSLLERYQKIKDQLDDPKIKDDTAKTDKLRNELLLLQVRLRDGMLGLPGMLRSGRAWFICNMLTAGGLCGAWEYADIAPVVRTGLSQVLTASRQGTSDLKEIPMVTTFPPLFETSVVELARTGDPQAVPLLLEVLRRRQVSGSPEAAAGLGNFRYRLVANELINALTADDGWLRFCAWRSLSAMSGDAGKQLVADWFNGSPREFAAVQAKYREWMAGAFR
ncbi:MAG: HEAT repeat domain-containing protein [Planctomycetota bacterium]